MPTFSSLPNEIILTTWGFVDEPEDIESFALVSKQVYSLSVPFVREHAGMKSLYPTISIDVDGEPDGAYDVLQRLIHNPRYAFYIHEALIEDWTTSSDRRSVSSASLSPERIAEYDGAVRCSFYVPPSEKEDWIREIKKGNPDPIVALVIMRLTKLRYLRLVYPQSGGKKYLLETLERMTLSPVGASIPGPSVIQNGPNGGNISMFKKPSPFVNITKIEMNLGRIRPNVLSNLLRATKNLKSFAFTPTDQTPFNFRRLTRELSRCAGGSLRKLDLHDYEESHRCIGRLTGFQNLVKLSINMSLLLGRGGRRIADVLPPSVEELFLYLGDSAEPVEVEEAVDQVVQCKVERCPGLHTFWVESVDTVEMDDEEESQLVEKLAEVGVEFNMGEYSNL